MEEALSSAVDERLVVAEWEARQWAEWEEGWPQLQLRLRLRLQLQLQLTGTWKVVSAAGQEKRPRWSRLGK